MTPLTPIGIQRIEKRLDAFANLIDLGDMKDRPQQQRSVFLSRALAAWTVKVIGGTDPATAAKCVTDTFHDRGIDAIFYDPGTARLIVIQSKWSNGIGWKDVGEFVDGVRKLIAPDLAAFSNNPKINARRAEIESALLSSAKIQIVTVHHGAQPADGASLKRVDDLVIEIDGGAGLAEAVHWHQSDLLVALQEESAPPSISCDLYLSNWGEIKEPYHAVFGRVQGGAIAALGKKYPHLAHLNLRERLYRSDVNAAIAQTILNEPHHFWYFNNGLTIICESIKPGLSGRLNPELALFKFEGISLVNGAQTTGVVSEYLSQIPESERDKLWIQIRVIAVKQCPDDSEKSVTRYTNLQNAVTLQDFVSLDPIQSRLGIDFAIQKRRYAVRSGGESEPTGDAGCTLIESTSALACADSDVRLAYQRKREIALLWDTQSDRYKSLFHPNLSAVRVWNAVIIMREAIATINILGWSDKPKADMLASHMQWIITHMVFQSPALANWDTAADPKALLPEVKRVTTDVFEKMRSYIQTNHANEYLAAFSKNYEKCETLVKALATGFDSQNLYSGYP